MECALSLSQKAEEKNMEKVLYSEIKLKKFFWEITITIFFIFFELEHVLQII